jgi:hypothetical protein
MDYDREFIMACARGDLSAAKKYVKRGVEVQVENNLAFRWSLCDGHLGVIEWLASKITEENGHVDATKDVLDNIESDVYYRAFRNGHSNILRFLLNTYEIDIGRIFEVACTDSLKQIKHFVEEFPNEMKSIHTSENRCVSICLERNSLKSARYLDQLGFLSNAETLYSALSSGNMLMVRWVLDRYLPTPEEIHRSFVYVNQYPDLYKFLEEFANNSPK